MCWLPIYLIYLNFVVTHIYILYVYKYMCDILRKRKTCCKKGIGYRESSSNLTVVANVNYTFFLFAVWQRQVLWKNKIFVLKYLFVKWISSIVRRVLTREPGGECGAGGVLRGEGYDVTREGGLRRHKALLCD